MRPRKNWINQLSWVGLFLLLEMGMKEWIYRCLYVNESGREKMCTSTASDSQPGNLGGQKIAYPNLKKIERS